MTFGNFSSSLIGNIFAKKACAEISPETIVPRCFSLYSEFFFNFGAVAKADAVVDVTFQIIPESSIMSATRPRGNVMTKFSHIVDMDKGNGATILKKQGYPWVIDVTHIFYNTRNTFPLL